MAIGVVLLVLLLLPFFAVGAVCILIGAIGFHVYRSHGVGAALRGHLDRHVFGVRTIPAGGTPRPRDGRRP